MLAPAPMLPSKRNVLCTLPGAVNYACMNTQAMVQSLPQRDTCPYCGQPVTRRQLDEIRERVRKEEQARLKVLEQQLRSQTAAAFKAEVLIGAQS